MVYAPLYQPGNCAYSPVGHSNGFSRVDLKTVRSHPYHMQYCPNIRTTWNHLASCHCQYCHKCNRLFCLRCTPVWSNRLEQLMTMHIYMMLRVILFKRKQSEFAGLRRIIQHEESSTNHSLAIDRKVWLDLKYCSSIDALWIASGTHSVSTWRCVEWTWWNWNDCGRTFSGL